MMKFLLGLLIVCTTIFHTYNLEALPQGLFLDEYSIGLNAAHILTEGKDEFGHPYPIYFEAFGEYKNPLFIYATAGVFKVFGINDTALRLTSALFFLCGFFFFLGFLQRYFKKTSVTFLGGLMFAFLPLFFTLSRVSFEVVSHIAVFTCFLFLLTYLFRTRMSWKSVIAHLVGGGILALTLYTYTTARFLTPVFLVFFLLLYTRKGQLQHVSIFLCGFALGSIPFLWIILYAPHILLARYNEISLFGHGWDMISALPIIFFQFLSYFSPDFLFLHGDHIMRHHSGFGGMIGIFITILFSIGLVASCRKSSPHSKIGAFLMFVCFLTPLAAATTEGDHALRVALYGIPVIYLALHGIQWLQSKKTWWSMCIITVCILGILIESSLYLQHWFTIYPKKTVAAFGTLGVEKIIDFGNNNKATTYILSPNIPKAETLAKYLRFTHPQQTFRVQKTPDTIPKYTCIMTTLSEKEAREKIAHTIIVPFPPSAKVIGMCGE